MAKQPDRSPVLSFLYRTAAGRFLLKGLTAPPVSRLAGRYLDSHLSRIHIAGFVRRYGMDLTGCEKQSFSSFNDFFTRRLRPDQRPIDLDPAAFISPCDGQLSVFHLNSSRMFQIKGSRYSLPDLLGGQENATRYANGLCLVFRLCVDDYHRYCYIDWGVKGENHFLPGILHTVRPIALASCPVFIQNSREYTGPGDGAFRRRHPGGGGRPAGGPHSKPPRPRSLPKGPGKGPVPFWRLYHSPAPGTPSGSPFAGASDPVPRGPGNSRAPGPDPGVRSFLPKTLFAPPPRLRQQRPRHLFLLTEPPSGIDGGLFAYGRAKGEQEGGPWGQE